jgi:polyisoprenoid-binding protein YceI
MNDTTTTVKARRGMSRWKKWVIGGGLVFVAIVGVGIWWFLRDDAPSEVNLDAAVGAIDGGRAVSVDGVNGNWAVDTSIGEFSFEDSTGSFVGFRVQEELSGIGSTTAVGRTPAVSGTITIDGTTLTATSIEADMSELTTDDSRRDRSARDALETSQFPSATFVLTSPIDLGDAATTGARAAVTATGDLTVHGVTKSVNFPLEAQLTGNNIVVVGSLDVLFSDFGVTAPTSRIALSVDDHGTLELQLFFSRS